MGNPCAIRLPTAGGLRISRRLAAIAPALLVTIFGCCDLAATASPGPFAVKVEEGRRQTAAGDHLFYTLYIPQPAGTLPAPPLPGVILSHGFARDRRFHRLTAEYLAQRGLVVLTPNATSLLGGAPDQLRNIANLAELYRWLVARSTTAGDSLEGILDARRLALAGHSAGGSISFEAAIDLQSGPNPPAAICLLDAVPWSRTLDRAPDLQPLPMQSLRSEPSPCNADGSVLDLLDRLSFPLEDLRLIGGTHCDPENPTDIPCMLVCNGSSNQVRELYRDLLYAFLGEHLEAPRLDAGPPSYAQAVERLLSEQRLQRELRGAPGSGAASPLSS